MQNLLISMESIAVMSVLKGQTKFVLEKMFHAQKKELVRTVSLA